MHLTKTTALAAACLTLVGCGLFGKEKLKIDGERIPVLNEKSVIAADYMAGDIEIALPAPYENSSWSQNGGNAEHNMGHLAGTQQPEKIWSRNFGAGNSKRDYLIAEPVIAGKTVFTIDADAVVSAFRQNDGSRLWKQRLKPQLRQDKEVSLKGAGLAFDNNTLYATTGFGGVFALDRSSGKIKWQYFAKTPIRIAPTAGGGKLFVQTIDNTLLALDASSGREIWRYAAPSEETTLVGGAVPAYSENLDLLIAGFTNGELRALKANTGSPLWGDYLVSSRRTNSLDDINVIHVSPVIAGDTVFAAGSNNLLVAIDLRSGQRIWEREISTNNQPWAAGKYLYVLTEDARLLAVQSESGKIIWDTKIPAANDEQAGTRYAGPLLINNRLLVNASDGKTFFVSPYSGKISGVVTNGEGSSLPPVAAEKQIIITTTDADIIAYQ